MGRRKPQNKATVIGEGFSITGDVKGTGPVMISGQVKGDADIEGLVELTSTAIWDGDIRADNAIIGGTLKGNIFAADKLEITASARIFGNVSSASISIVQGAVINGEMKIHGSNAVNETTNQYNADTASEKPGEVPVS